MNTSIRLNLFCPKKDIPCTTKQNRKETKQNRYKKKKGSIASISSSLELEFWFHLSTCSTQRTEHYCCFVIAIDSVNLEGITTS